MQIKTKIVDKSWNTRRLELIPVLEKYLDQVKQYKVVNKLHELFYNKPETKGVTNKFYSGLLKTQYSFYISENYNRLKVCFFDIENDKSKDSDLEFNITDKSIPSIIQGLNVYKTRLIEWRETENEMSVSTYRFEQAVEEHFDKEMTQLQFNISRKELAQYLINLANEVSKVKPE